MKNLVSKTIQLNLVGINSNAFSILNAFQRQAHRKGWTDEEIDLVLAEAKTRDYEHLLAVIINHCENVDDENLNKILTN